MFKCPKGTPAQIKADQLKSIKKPEPDSINLDDDVLLSHEEGVKSQSDEKLDLDSVKADKRCPVTARESLIYFFINCALDVLVKSWNGKFCQKEKLDNPDLLSNDDTEDYGELYPCEYPSTVSVGIFFF
ncbi:hypothetical protein Phum_PHUM509050 [Pediculus humanus corporis]|uniref:Uncharacterized protein n=1 Tax=Pediculus humanus subsp. corporis TaxID=121224 RepID=E0VY34_PEDHC|nr:uncharacterized protein Phum_PHUM509050 [Pediculus humanus corporis]EEB18290.1 hypothetical protein Phum_PHUM509050 [Pediculus humanus corporis]